MLRTIVRVLLVLVVVLLLPRAAYAQRELLSPLGAKHTLALDQLSGFRASAVGGIVGGAGFAYAGPIGFARQSYTEAAFNNIGDTTVRTTTIWFAPSADFFVIESLSVGGLIEVSSTSGSIEIPINAATRQTNDLATTTNFTILPRVGYLIAFTERFGLWPRAGFGYAARQRPDPNNANDKNSTYGFLIDLDVGLIYRPVEPVYFRLGPELAFSLGASHSRTTGGTTISANASWFQFAALGGVGIFLDL